MIREGVLLDPPKIKKLIASYIQKTFKTYLIYFEGPTLLCLVKQ